MSAVPSTFEIVSSSPAPLSNDNDSFGSYTSSEGGEDSESFDSSCKVDDEPPFLYTVGKDLTAEPHLSPPSPFGYAYTTEWPGYREDWNRMSQTTFCLACEPAEGTVQGQVDDNLGTCSFTITSLHPCWLPRQCSGSHCATRR